MTAAIGGVVLVIINKFLELEESYKLWKEYRATCEALRQERLLYLTATNPYDEVDAFPRLVDKTEAILANKNQKWKRIARPDNHEKIQAEKKQESPVLSDN